MPQTRQVTMQEHKTAVAVVRDEHGRLLVTFNDQWGGYGFPMLSIPEGVDAARSHAIQVLERELGFSLPDAVATELECMSQFELPKGSNEEILCNYWLCAVDLGKHLDLQITRTSKTHPPLFFTHKEITHRS